MVKPRETKQAATAIELRPDGWERFERAVDAATRVPAKHRTSPKPASDYLIGISEVASITVPEEMRRVMRANSQAVDQVTRTARGSR